MTVDTTKNRCSNSSGDRKPVSFKQRNINLVKIIRKIGGHFDVDQVLLNDICDQIMHTDNNDYGVNAGKKIFSIEWNNRSGNISTNVFSSGLFGSNEYFSIFIENFKIQQITLSFMRKKKVFSGYKYFHGFNLTYDKDFKIAHMEEHYEDINLGSIRNVIIQNQLSNDELYKNIKTKLKMNDEIHTLLPEITTKSAYDFNSDEFNSRLLLVEMLLF